MPRPPASVLWLATLASGAALGLTLGPRGTPLAAQVKPAETKPSRPAEDEAVYRDLSRNYERFEVFDRTFEMVARAVSPSVVHITARKTGPREDGVMARYEETGSGVIVRPEAGKGLYVLTNNHVVDGAQAPEISILLHDGQVLRPERFWADPKADVAVLKLTRDGLPAARLGNSDDARVGTWVLAVGSPFGLTHSVSQGIISARGRYEEELENDGVEHQEFLQTDAAINPGNSGGPLVNMKGEVVGLNTAIASEGGGSEGVGFSIPINLAKWAMHQLITEGKVARGAMGVNLSVLTPGKATELGLDRPRGARIVAVHEDSPAALAGLAVGDIVLKFNGVDVHDDKQLIGLVSISPIGRPSDVVVWRGGKSMALRVTLADRDAVLARSAPGGDPRRNEPAPRRDRRPAPALRADDLGLTLVTAEESARPRVGTAPGAAPRGVAIADLDATSPYARHLRIGDVLEAINGVVIRTPEEAIQSLRRPAGAPPLEIALQRVNAGAARALTIRVP